LDGHDERPILVVNPGSTTTKVALFLDDRLEREETLPAPEREPGEGVWEEFPLRLEGIRGWLSATEVDPSRLSAVVGRGGLLRPLEGGAWEVTEAMLADARSNVQGEHASNLGCALARAIADLGEKGREMGAAGAGREIPAFIVDPVATDEFHEVARLSGLAEIPRRSLSHALSIHALVREACARRGGRVEESRFVVAHLGGGISVCPVEGGRIVDANNANSGGPFSPSRTGGLPVQELLDLAFSGTYTKKELQGATLKGGGLMSYLGTADAREVEGRIREGDARARLVYEAMAYQISKEIGAMATVLEGRVDRILLTGGLAGSELLTDWIRDRVSFVAPVEVWPEVEEMKALAAGALRVLRGEETAKRYVIEDGVVQAG
jgi:butyrate kinase